jgi:ribosomal protein S18 acetylase RimI-like enzyme
MGVMADHFTIRPLDPGSQRELDHVCVFSVMTLWESRPELRVDPATLPDFGYDAHKRIILAGADNPAQRYLIALDDHAHIVGHSIVLVRKTDDGEPYGYFWSRYVLPRYRRQGLARRFLSMALEWFSVKGARFAEVHVHIENTPLRDLFEQQGFRVVDRRTEHWTFLVLRKDLVATHP